VDKTVAQAREVHHPYGIALGLRYRVLMLTDLGRLIEAEENAEEVIRIQKELDNKDEELIALVLLVRTYLAMGDLQRAGTLLVEVEELVEQYDTEGFAPVVHAWRARIHAQLGNEDEARAALLRAESIAERRWSYQVVRVQLNMAKAHELLGDREKTAELAAEALRIADASGYRHYAMRARQIVARTTEDPAIAEKQRRVAEALARSLAATLPPEQSRSFLAAQGLDVSGG